MDEKQPATEATITYTDGTVVTLPAKPAPRDLIAMERHWKVPVGAMDKDGRFELIAWMMWHRLTRQGEERDFETWLDAVEDIEVPDEEAEAVPTEAALST